MDETHALLRRIADALERLAPAAPEPTDWLAAPAYVWNGSARAVPRLEAPPLDLLHGIDQQKQAVVDNVARLARGHAAHDMLLWGARGMGKSALLRASVRAAQANGGNLALVQVASGALDGLPALFSELAVAPRNILVFIDDLGFAEGDTEGPRALRSWLDGGVEARPANVRLAVTANRRAILARYLAEQDPDRLGPVNPRDAVDDSLALADRFGLSLGFHVCSQDEYLAIVAGYAQAYGLHFDAAEALEWARRRGARSGRVAWHFITELAGRAGRRL
ncbi:MAG: ATP-binding protein [Alteraurantiacibacter sp.]|nr:ATP-binding protein [Alteraurantiacibacter sp.]